MLILTEKDMLEAVDYDDMMDAVEHAFTVFIGGDFYMPERYSAWHNGDSMLYMPCFSNEALGTKILSQFPKNPANNKPYIDGIMLLNSRSDGSILAAINGRVLTALRTGAVGGVAVNRLSRSNCKTLGIIGCGAQGLWQTRYACHVKDIEKVYLFDSQKPNLSSFIRDLRCMDKSGKMNNIEYIVCKTSEEIVKNCDIIITATPSTSPVLPNDPDLLFGKCIIAVGSWKPEMREIPDAIFKVADYVYTELPYACEESGDLSQPLERGILTHDRVRYMGEYLNELSKGNTPNHSQTTFYKSVGMGLFDLTAAQKIFECARKKGIGVEIEF